LIYRLILMASVAIFFVGCQQKSQAQAPTTLKSKPAVMAKRAIIGEPAPGFTLVSTSGEAISLTQYSGKVIVLEWFNPDCPFVKVAHTEGKLAQRAKQHVAEGGVWLAINSGAPGRQGAGKERNRKARVDYGLSYPILLDESGAVGKIYGATRTPHIYVIDASGTLVYAGALDSTGGTGYAGTMTDYLGDALVAVKGSKPVKNAQTKSWGCSVKYAR